jgi:hypothetical protein
VDTLFTQRHFGLDKDYKDILSFYRKFCFKEFISKLINTKKSTNVSEKLKSENFGAKEQNSKYFE